MSSVRELYSVDPFRVGDSQVLAVYLYHGLHPWLLLVRPSGAQNSVFPRVTE
jgi:hypothetical protein